MTVSERWALKGVFAESLVFDLKLKPYIKGGLEEALDAVESAKGVRVREALLMRPIIPNFPQLERKILYKPANQNKNGQIDRLARLDKEFEYIYTDFRREVENTRSQKRIKIVKNTPISYSVDGLPFNPR